jgi:hypothetical protein
MLIIFSFSLISPFSLIGQEMLIGSDMLGHALSEVLKQEKVME